jgi:hypothetical protein
MKLVTSKYEELMTESKKITNGSRRQRRSKNKQWQARREGIKLTKFGMGSVMRRKKGERYNLCTFSLDWK